MYLVDKIDWLSFFDLLEKIAGIRDEVKKNEDKFRPLMQKWTERSKDITDMCISVVQLTCYQIEKIFDLLNKLQSFDDKQDSFQRRLKICCSNYFAKKFD